MLLDSPADWDLLGHMYDRPAERSYGLEGRDLFDKLCREVFRRITVDHQQIPANVAAFCTAIAYDELFNCMTAYKQ